MLAFSQSLWLLQFTCSCALLCNAEDTQSFIGVSSTSLLMASSSWLPSRPKTWLVVALFFVITGGGLAAFFFPGFLFGFFIVSCASRRGLSPRRHLLQLQLI